MSTRYIGGLAVEVEGSGEAIVCIHGLGGTSNTWTPLLRAMRNNTIIRIDLPGSGRSPSVIGELTIARMAEAVISVCQQLDVSIAHFVGHSMGSIVCQYVAAQKASLVKTMTLFGPLACPPDAARPNIVARAEKAASGGAIAMQEIADAIVNGTLAASTRDALPIVVTMVRESLMRQDAQGYSKSCMALSQVLSAALEDITAPTLLITGDEDPVAPPSTVNEMGRRIPKSRVVILTKCGHWTPVERPAECIGLIEESLRRR